METFTGCVMQTCKDASKDNTNKNRPGNMFFLSLSEIWEKFNGNILILLAE